jgi:SAM-dependent methyltransferase
MDTLTLPDGHESIPSHGAVLCEQVRIGPGYRVLDLGHGPFDILDLLAERVGPSGAVVGVDPDPGRVASHQSEVAEHKFRNVSVVVGDPADTGFPASSFDVVHARHVLSHRADPKDVLAEMLRLVRPGGWVVGSQAGAAAPAQEADLVRQLRALYPSTGLTEVGMDVRSSGPEHDPSRHFLVWGLRPASAAGDVRRRVPRRPFLSNVRTAWRALP